TGRPPASGRPHLDRSTPEFTQSADTIPSNDLGTGCETVLKSRTVLLLVDQRCPHHPETTTGRSPLEVEHPIKGILCGPLRLSVIPRKPVSLHVVFLDREHTLDDSAADVNPRFLTAVFLDPGVRP